MTADSEQVPDALVSVVIPSFNEERTIEEVIRRVAGVPFRTESWSSTTARWTPRLRSFSA